MTQQDSSGTQPATDAFALRVPSQTWEVVTLATNPPISVWFWFKPMNAPSALMIQVPPGSGAAFTLRLALHTVGVDPSSVVMGSLFGAWFQPEAGASAYFDQPVVGPPPGGDPNIVLHFEAPQMASPEPATDVAPRLDNQTKEIFREMERDWKAIRSSERQLGGLKKQLTDMQARLNTMNRDLSPDEKLYSDRSDLDDWREARRWLRDAASRLSKYVKEFVAGESTYVGKKIWFEQIYKDYVRTQTPFPNMEQAHAEFQYFRRTVQNLCDRMGGAYHHAQQEGVGRAQAVLSRIAGKVASKRRR